MLKYNLGQKVMYKGIETKIIGVDKSDMALRRYAIGYVDPSPLATSHNLNIRVFGNRLRDFEYLEGEPNGHTWVTADDIKEIAKPKAVKVNLDNLMEVGKWFMELTGKKPFASGGLEFYKMFMDGSYENEDSIWLVENDDNTFHYNHSKTMETPRLHDEWEVLEYKKEDKGMRFEKEGFEFRGWKLGEEVMYEGEIRKIIAFKGDGDLAPIGVSYSKDIGIWDRAGVTCVEGEPDMKWALEDEIKRIIRGRKIYSFAELHGKKSACGNFFIEATPRLIKVFTKTATRDSVGVFQVGRTSKLNTLADLTNFGFELYELVEFELSDVTRKKFAGFGNKKVCKLASIGDVWFVRVYHDGKDGQYDTISLTKEDKINKAEFLVGEVK